MQHMKKDQPDVTDHEDCIREAVLHNLHQIYNPEKHVVALPDALRGPAHVAKLTLRNAEQLTAMQLNNWSA